MRKKTRGVLKGIIRKQNCCNQHYLAAPVPAQLQEEMLNKELVIQSSQSKHHQFRTAYEHRQGLWILKLLDVLKSHKLGLKNKQYHHIKNFFTGKVFPHKPSQQIVGSEKYGDKSYREIIKERLQTDITARIFAPVKQLQVNCYKKHFWKTPVKLRDCILWFKDDANIWRKMAIISKLWEADCSKTISSHELIITPRCLMDATRSMCSGHTICSNFYLFERICWY